MRFAFVIRLAPGYYAPIMTPANGLSSANCLAQALSRLRRALHARIGGRGGRRRAHPPDGSRRPPKERKGSPVRARTRREVQPRAEGIVQAVQADMVSVPSCDARHLQVFAGVGRDRKRDRRQKWDRRDPGERLGVRRLLDDSVPGEARCHSDLRKKRVQSGPALRAPVHGQGAAGAGDRGRGHSRHQLVICGTRSRTMPAKRIR